jgi:tRNA(fMet)-specific endonuclease VapC
VHILNHTCGIAIRDIYKNIERDCENLANFLIGIPVLPFDTFPTVDYGIVRTFLEPRDMPIGPLDTLIAAHARSLNLTVVT